MLETHDSFPRKVKFDFFGDRVDQYPLEIGDEVTVSFDIESREFNGRWYTDIRGWKAEKGVATAATAADAAYGQGGPAPAPMPGTAPIAQGTPTPSYPDPFAAGAGDSDGDLPF